MICHFVIKLGSYIYCSMSVMLEKLMQMMNSSKHREKMGIKTRDCSAQSFFRQPSGAST